jgi:hypothetical protein
MLNTGRGVTRCRVILIFLLGTRAEAVILYE